MHGTTSEMRQVWLSTPRRLDEAGCVGIEVSRLEDIERFELQHGCAWTRLALAAVRSKR